MVLVGVTWASITVALRVVGVVHMLDVLGGLLGPVVRHGQPWTKNTVDSGRRLEGNNDSRKWNH